MNALGKKYTILEGHNVIKCKDANRTLYLIPLTAASSITRLFMSHGGEDGEYGCTFDDITVFDCENSNLSANGVLITFEYDDQESNRTWFFDLLVDYPYGTFISEWY